jgi:hypothetical protein
VTGSQTLPSIDNPRNSEHWAVAPLFIWPRTVLVTDCKKA